MKKAMILGAAAGQIPFIKICKEFNAYVIVVSRKGNYPGFEYADECLYLDTTDKEGILEAAKEKDIDAILTDQTDVSVPTVAYVAEKLGLRGIGTDVAEKFTDKYAMRKAAKDIGVGVPDFCEASTYEEAEKAIYKIGFPVIVKPVDSSGSRGITKICDDTIIDFAINDAFKNSNTNRIIVEKFIVGREFLVNGFGLNYKYRNLDIGIKEYFDLDGRYVSKMCMFTSADAYELPEEKAILETNEKLVKGLNLPFGITHAEYIYSYEEEKVYLVEIAARGGGVFLSSDLTPRASGVNTNKIIIDYALNGTVIDIDNIVLDKKTTAFRCFELAPGKICEVLNVKETENIPGVFKVDVDDLRIGTEIHELVDDSEKKGPVLIVGNNMSECYDILNKVENTLQVYTEKDGIKEGIRW